MSSPSRSNSHPDPNSHIKKTADALKNAANIHGDNLPAITKSVTAITNDISPHVLLLFLTTLDSTFMDRARAELNKRIIEAAKSQFDEHQDEAKEQPDMVDFFSSWKKSTGKWGDDGNNSDSDSDDDVLTPPNTVNNKPSLFNTLADVHDEVAELAGEYKNLRKENRRLRNPNKTRGGAPKTFANSVDQRDPTPSESRIPQSRSSSHRSPPLPAGTKWQTMPMSVKSKNSGVVAEKKENPQPNRELAKTSWKWFFLIKLGQRVRDTLPDLKDNWFRCEQFDDDHLVGWRGYKSGPYENYTATRTSAYQHSIRHDADKTNPTKWRHYKRTENSLVEFEDHIAFEEHVIASS
jgi:hypothetical protein